ncbi:MAG: nickel pincer cofactor biosynthesis protein LarB [Pirellulaceae bacterium]|nr:nickel pincer cofactor biosynthesis protein LarB [Pirellulaceae bacterium]
MDLRQAERLISDLLGGRISQAEAVAALSRLPAAELPDATIDLDRRRRCGFPEVVFGESKSVPTLLGIFERLLAAGQPVLATRISVDKGAAIVREFPAARYSELARTIRIEPEGSPLPAKVGKVAIVTAGTSDIPVAEEVRETADWMGAHTDLIVDVGVAGPQRLLAQLPRIITADAVVVVAGMEAALASVVGGHVPCPVIAVPTSIGYGANFGGLAALLGMLNSCAANVTVVNIDAGFKGGFVAGLIARRAGIGSGE